MYSASAADVETVFCFLAAQETAPEPVGMQAWHLEYQCSIVFSFSLLII
jgi:hypothetical protein